MPTTTVARGKAARNQIAKKNNKNNLHANLLARKK